MIIDPDPPPKPDAEARALLMQFVTSFMEAPTPRALRIMQHRLEEYQHNFILRRKDA